MKILVGQEDGLRDFLAPFQWRFQGFYAAQICASTLDPVWRRYFASKGAAGHVERPCMRLQAPCTWRRRDWGNFVIYSKGTFKVFC